MKGFVAQAIEESYENFRRLHGDYMKNKKAVEYLKSSILEKANKYKDFLGTVYNKLIIATDLMDFNELLELNDLSLLIEYFEYLKAVKQNRKASLDVEKSCDKSVNFSLISTDEGDMSLDTSSISDDKKEAQENIIFKENSYNGALIFEDDDSDVIGLEELKEDLDFNKNLWDEDIDSDMSIDDLTDLLNDTSSLLSDNESSNINEFGIDINALEKELDAFSDNDSKDFFNDFTDDDIENDFENDFENEEFEDLVFEKTPKDENLNNQSVEDESNSSELEEDSEDEEDDSGFNAYYQSELDKKWGMFKINLPGWTVEDLDTMPLTSIATLIRNDKIGLPDDLTTLTDDMIDFLMQQRILTERPQKKVDIEVNEESSSLDSGVEAGNETEEELEKRLFEDKSATEVVEKADMFRKMLFSKSKKSLEVDNTEYFEQEKAELNEEQEILKELSLKEMQTENDILNGENQELLNDFDEAFDNITF